MEDHINRRRFIGTGIAGVTTIAATRPTGALAAPFATTPDPPEGEEQVVDATLSGGNVHVLTAREDGYQVRVGDAGGRRTRRLTEMSVVPVDAAFDPTGFAAGSAGLVGALRSQRRRTFETELRGELPDALRHLTATIPTTGHSTAVELVWEPGVARAAEMQASSLRETAGTFGHVLSASALPAPAAPRRPDNPGGRGRKIAGLGVAGQLVADIVRIALIERGTIVRETPIAHDESAIAAYTDDAAALVLVRRDSDQMTWSIDLAAGTDPPPRQPIGAIAGTPKLARWRSGVVMIDTSDGELHARSLGVDGRWADAKIPRARKPGGSGPPAAVPLGGGDDLLVVADRDTIAIEGS